MIRIIDCGSQLTQNIARRVRELGIFTEIIPFNNSSDILNREGLEGIVISGGQFSVHDNNSPKYSNEVFDLDVPVLGICYGQQSICHMFGGRVTSTENREYGATEIKIEKDSLLFKGINKNEFSVWMSHGDIVETLPDRFEVIATSSNGHIASIQNENQNIYAVQFHPEVDHTDNGRIILDNFIEICNAQRVWNPEKDYERIVQETSEKLKNKIGVGGISGGIDSTAVSVLVGKIIGDRYHPIFVDNGLLRLNEADQVKRSLDLFNLNVNYVDAGFMFLRNLQDIRDPDEKRKTIGNDFVEVFQYFAKKFANASFLVQGTLYPDVIESVPLYGSSSVIKRHHNVGGLPEKMELEVIEPFRHLFKDEVRSIAENELNIPKEIVWRHPFPGPGLAIRITGAVNEKKLDILRRVDAIYLEELDNRGLYYNMSQAFAGLNNSKTVGVMGDEGTYETDIRLRAVTTNDFMTSDIYHFKWEDLQAITNRIINEVKGVNRVFYDTTQKPPGTIECE